MRGLAACLEGPHDLRLVERDWTPAAGEILVRTRAASICDADLRAYRGLPLPTDLPDFRWIGHEGGGTVVAVGSSGLSFQPGDEVMCFGPLNTWAPYFRAAPEQLLPAPPGLDPVVACLGEPIAVGLFGVVQSGLLLGDTVAVAGLNFQGLLAVQAFRRMGAGRIIAIDDDASRRALARGSGADEVFTSDAGPTLAAIRDFTRGRGCDVVFHSCGYWHPRAEAYFDLCLEATRDEGIMVSLPDMMGQIRANLHRVHHHAIDLRFPALMHHAPPFRELWVPRLLRPVVDGLVDVSRLITARYPLNEAPAALARFDADPSQVKILLTA